MRYAIAIPAVLACAFYVYVFVQLRRDEKRHNLPAASSRESAGLARELQSFSAVREPGHSFAQWSRLTRRRRVPESGGRSSDARKREQN